MGANDRSRNPPDREIVAGDQRKPAEETFTAAQPTARDKDQEDEREQEPQRKQAQSQVEDLDPQPVAKDEYDGLFDLPEPPEATVTFVVREAPRSKQA